MRSGLYCEYIINVHFFCANVRFSLFCECTADMQMMIQQKRHKYKYSIFLKKFLYLIFCITFLLYNIKILFRQFFF